MTDQTDAVYRAAWDSFYAYDGDDENATCQTNILFGSDYLTDAIAAEVARRVDEALGEYLRGGAAGRAAGLAELLLAENDDNPDHQEEPDARRDS
jgi:hypothetical protein